VVANVNDPPTVWRILSPLNGTMFAEGVNVTFSAEFSDPDTVLGQVLTIVWRSNVSGMLKEFTSENATSFTRNDLAIGRHLVTVTVSDGEQERSASLAIEVKAKAVPPIDGGDDGEGGGFPYLLVGMVLIVIVVLVGLLLFLRSRKG